MVLLKQTKFCKKKIHDFPIFIIDFLALNEREINFLVVFLVDRNEPLCVK